VTNRYRSGTTCFTDKCAGHYTIATIELAPEAGIEPATNGLTVRCTTAVLLWNCLVAGPGVEPGTKAYETFMIPFQYPAIEFECASIWCPKGDLNPQNLDFESNTYTGSVIGANEFVKCLPSHTSGALSRNYRPSGIEYCYS
jgi:hypothetical protein